MRRKKSKPAKEHRHFSFDTALAELKAANLKRTRPRETLLRHLVENHGPFSAKDLHRALRGKDLDAVTIYRCLATFEEAGLVRRCDFGDGVARFELNDPGAHHHHHVICVDCRKIEVLGDCHLSRLENEVRERGYSHIRHVLEFSGRCKDCAEKSA